MFHVHMWCLVASDKKKEEELARKKMEMEREMKRVRERDYKMSLAYKHELKKEYTEALKYCKIALQIEPDYQEAITLEVNG